jgi:CRISPR/Cas system CSM-associated protein Csm2 small subunit
MLKRYERIYEGENSEKTYTIESINLNANGKCWIVYSYDYVDFRGTHQHKVDTSYLLSLAEVNDWIAARKGINLKDKIKIDLGIREINGVSTEEKQMKSANKLAKLLNKKIQKIKTGKYYTDFLV